MARTYTYSDLPCDRCRRTADDAERGPGPASVGVGGSVLHEERIVIEPTDIIGDDVRLYRGDAFDAIWSQDESSIDAVVIDPPYCSGGISEASRTAAPGQGLRSENIRKFGWFVGDNMGTDGLTWMLRSVALESRRIVKPTGSLLVFCDWRMSYAIKPAIEAAGLRFQNEVIWNKGSMGLGVGFRAQHEKVLHFTYGGPEYHAADVGTVIESKRVRGADREHQTQKPVNIMRELIRVVSPGAGRVLDCFMGSGSTGVAATQLGIGFVGAEMDPTHYATALRRLTHATGAGPGQLFGAAS